MTELVRITVKLANVSKSKKIYHRNDLRQALSQLSLPPRRILWLILAQLNKDDSGCVVYEENQVFSIHAREYAALCQIDESVAYKQLKKGVEEIRTHLMRVQESELYSKEEFEKRNRPRDGMVLFTIANYGYYSDGSGFIEVQLDPIMTPFISKLKDNFTGQFLLSALRLPDTNASKLYLLLREWISSGFMLYKEIEVDELRDKLGISDVKTYSEFKDFKKLFFQRSIGRILEATEFSKIEMEITERRARKAHKVRITYEFKGQMGELKEAGFIAGHKKKDKKQDKKPVIDDGQPQIADKYTADEEGLKQINGRYHDRQSATAAGYNWDSL